jgi:hypothetical protein
MSESKRPRLESKARLENDRALHELQVFTAELLSGARPTDKGSSYKSLVDPLVNFNMEMLVSAAAAGGAPPPPPPASSGAQEAVIRKLTAEIEELKRQVAATAGLEKQLLKKDATIRELKGEIVQAKQWIDDLVDKNDKLATQLLVAQQLGGSGGGAGAASEAGGSGAGTDS